MFIDVAQVFTAADCPELEAAYMLPREPVQPPLSLSSSCMNLCSSGARILLLLLCKKRSSSTQLLEMCRRLRRVLPVTMSGWEESEVQSSVEIEFD